MFSLKLQLKQINKTFSKYAAIDFIENPALADNRIESRIYINSRSNELTRELHRSKCDHKLLKEFKIYKTLIKTENDAKFQNNKNNKINQQAFEEKLKNKNLPNKLKIEKLKNQNLKHIGIKNLFFNIKICKSCE